MIPPTSMLGPDGEIMGGGGWVPVDGVPGLYGADTGMIDIYTGGGYTDFVGVPSGYEADFGSFGGQYNTFGGGGGSNINVGYGGGGISIGGQIPGSGINIGVTIPTGGGGGGTNVKELLTQIVNSHESALKMNLAQWQAGQLSGSSALEKGWQIMNSMVATVRQYPPNGELAAMERDRRINPSYLKWDWIAYYLDPITGGPSEPAPLPSGGTTMLPGGNTLANPLGIDPLTLLLIGGLLFFALKN